MKYRLYHKDYEIGIINQLDQDFPNLFGKYELNENLEQENTLISQYVEYSVHASILMETNEEKWQDFMEKGDPKFIDLIESENWKLIDEKEKTHKILIPNFCDKKEIVWRWDF